MKVTQKIPPVRTLVLALATTLTLASCASVSERESKYADQKIRPETLNRFNALAQPGQQDDIFSVDTGGFYAAKKPIQVAPINPEKQLPEAFQKSAKMNIQTPRSLAEVVALISSKSGYEISIDQDVLDAVGGGSSGGQSSPALAPGGVAALLSAQSAQPVSQSPLPGVASPPSALPPLPVVDANTIQAPGLAALPVLPSIPQVSAKDLMLADVIYDGSLQGLLDTVTARLGLSWRWTGKTVEVYRFDTKMFRLNALPGDQTSSSSLSTSGASLGGNSGGGSSGSNTSVSSTFAVWRDAEKSIQGMLSAGGKYSSNPSAGVIVVKDTPQVLSRVGSMLDEFNRVYGKQIRVNVQIWAVERNLEDSASIDWNAVWATASSRFGFNFKTGGDATGSPNAFSLGVNRGPWSGSSVVGSVMSSIGNSRLLTDAPFTALNGQTVPINSAVEQAYVAQSTSTLSGGIGGGTQSTITPGIVSEGFSMSVTPKVMEDNNVLIRYAVDLSTIESIENFTSPDRTTAIQLPRRAVKNFLQTAKIRSGETMVLSGFQQVVSNNSSQGPLSANAWWAGGAKKSKMAVRTYVIAITPYVVR